MFQIGRQYDNEQFLTKWKKSIMTLRFDFQKKVAELKLTYWLTKKPDNLRGLGCCCCFFTLIWEKMKRDIQRVTCNAVEMISLIVYTSYDFCDLRR